jgi:hypothetical protein
MSQRAAMRISRLAILLYLAGSPVFTFFARLLPAHVAPIVVTGALLMSVPLGVLLVRVMSLGREEDFAERYRKSEWSFVGTAVVSQIGVILASSSRPSVICVGLAFSAIGLPVAFGLLLRAAPVHGLRDTRSRYEEPYQAPDGGSRS